MGGVGEGSRQLAPWRTIGEGGSFGWGQWVSGEGEGGGWWRTTGDGESLGSSLRASVRHLKRRCDATGLVSTC